MQESGNLLCSQTHHEPHSELLPQLVPVLTDAQQEAVRRVRHYVTAPLLPHSRKSADGVYI